MFEKSDVSHAAKTHPVKKGAAKGAALAKSLVYLSLVVLVSAIALIYKYLLLALTYVMARLWPEEFDRDEVIDALTEVEKDSDHD